jgi:hypothetical protein
MWQDPLVAEIHQIRDDISASYGHDLHAIFAAAQRGDLSKNAANYDDNIAKTAIKAIPKSNSTQTASSPSLAPLTA